MSQVAQPPQVVVVKTQKSPVLAAVLGFFFGPFGLLYVGLAPAALMAVIVILATVFTAGMGLFLVWPLCALVGWSRASLYNKKLMQGGR